MKLYKHQKDLLNKNPNKHLLAWQTGVGKTLTAIKLAEQNAISTLVICPKSLKDNWKNEIDKWAYKKEEFNVLTKEEFKKYVQNLEGYDCLIVDEAHYFGNQKSQLTKALMKYIRKYNPPFIYLLTATPYLSTPFNIYSYAMILGKRWNWWKFKNEFFHEVKMGSRTVPLIKKGIENRIAQLVNVLGNTVRMDECVDVPDSIYMTEYFDLTDEQKKAIEGVEDINHIVRWTKIHQICGGTLKGDEYNENKFFKSEKLNRLLDLVKEHKKIAIVCRYNNEINYIEQKIKDKRVIKITGATKNKQKLIDEINALDEVAVLINAACSEGYGLPSIPIMVFYSYDFSLKNYIQLKGRIQRINAVQKCVYLSLVVKGTIDEDVFKMVTIKKQDFQLALYKK